MDCRSSSPWGSSRQMLPNFSVVAGGHFQNVVVVLYDLLYIAQIRTRNLSTLAATDVRRPTSWFIGR